MTIKSDKYYGLHIISLFCKAMTTILVIVGIGITGASLARILRMAPRPSQFSVFQMWFNESIVVLLIVGGIGFTFFIISQIIDVQMAINSKLNVITDVIQSMDKIVDAIERQENTEQPDTITYSQHKEIMQALNRQSRMLSKMYQDLVDDKGNSKINIEVE